MDELIGPYLDPFFWQRDAAGVQLIQTALDAATTQRPIYENWLRTFKVLREYVQAKNLDERWNLAFGYLRTSSGELWPRDIVKQLQAEGADPDTCRALLQVVYRR